MALPPASSDSLQRLALACAACRRCGLAEGRQQVVVSRGNPSARLMLIGEAPGAQEDAEGLPFVGRSGRLLDQLLAAAGLDSQGDAYVCNVVKCRPPDNRRPTAVEQAACRPWLEQQIAAVDPPLIVLLGATALEGVLGIRGGITKRRGQWLSSPAEVLRGRLLMPVLHPSYLLRFNGQAEGSPRALTAADFREVRRSLMAL
jgi:DNA polymerase